MQNLQSCCPALAKPALPVLRQMLLVMSVMHGLHIQTELLHLSAQWCLSAPSQLRGKTVRLHPIQT